jgi:hypothetical protein
VKREGGVAGMVTIFLHPISRGGEGLNDCMYLQSLYVRCHCHDLIKRSTMYIIMRSLLPLNFHHC